MAKGSDDSGKTDDQGGRGGKDDPVTHDLGDDKGGLRPAGAGNDDSPTHDVGDDKGGLRLPGASDDPLTHDAGDDKGGARLNLVFNQRTGQWIFTDDGAEHERWLDDHGQRGLEVAVSSPGLDDRTVPVWRFHDAASDVYFWTSDDRVKTEIERAHPELESQGEAFRAFADDRSGGQQAIGVVWDRDAGGDYGSFVYAPVDDAVRLAGQSDTDGLVYLGVAFWI